ncbi:phage tail protein [Nitrosomonas ureae]|uniref:Phage tail protein domain-containing protein n=1 Tax=Nitrosomonas ureae TaxID=44577 RepID=A0A1H9D0T4_9PROT|nr:phage tail protein [Nitrosomonas ureae]SEQ07075.1 phage tail protein domain-containing protein [Nitrosomonas ureae]
MDVNGTRFHLILGKDDWFRCQEDGAPHGIFKCVTFDEKADQFMLKSLPRRISHSQQPLNASIRCGAAVDRFGNCYWLANDRQQIFWQPSGTKQAHVYWAQKVVSCGIPSVGEFQPVTVNIEIFELAGLVVTEHHYLIVGNVSQDGLLIFDLHAGGEPMLLRFPHEVSFKPFDMAAAPGGGLWVLDRENHVYWGFDRDFRVLGVTAPSSGLQAGEEIPTFHSVDGEMITHSNQYFPAGFPVAACNPISIEALSDGSVLILDSPDPAKQVITSAVSSVLYHYRGTELLTLPVELKDQIETEETCADAADSNTVRLSVIAHDIVYDPASETLYAAESNGKQVIAFSMKLSPNLRLEVKTDYMPMHSFGGRALMMGGEAFGRKVLYDIVGGNVDQDTHVRWAPLQVIDDPHYARKAAILTPIFDGKTRNCVWDGLFLDACIPPEATVKIASRTDNDRDLIESAPFIDEPDLYLRGAGAEIPYYKPFADIETHPDQMRTRELLFQRARGQYLQISDRETLPDQMGTWELLFQRARGRYLQIRLELVGNSRVTPQIRAMRIYYPRFSYVEHYLPAVYREDQESASFLERLLANPKGFFSDIEAKIEDVSVLFEPRSAPSEAIDWLASWMGLALDPLWEGIHKQQSSDSHRPGFDRRRLFIRYAPRLYELRGTPNGIRLALQLLLDPCLEELLEQFEAAVWIPDTALRAELTRFNLPYPTPDLTRQALEELMFTYVLTSHRTSKVRIVERFMARDGKAIAAGDPTGGSGSVGEDTLAGSAHRFSVLIAEGLPPEQVAMVKRIVDLERPAHTAYDVGRFWDYFRVGEARLAVDTVLGEESRFVPIILGRNTLAEGYLASAPPMDTPERQIIDRDRLGDTVHL